MATSDSTGNSYEKHLQKTWDEIREHRDALNLLEGLLIGPAVMSSAVAADNEQLRDIVDALTTLVDEALIDGITDEWRRRYQLIQQRLQQM
jgi:hypothetical protein